MYVRLTPPIHKPGLNYQRKRRKKTSHESDNIYAALISSCARQMDIPDHESDCQSKTDLIFEGNVIMSSGSV